MTHVVLFPGLGDFAIEINPVAFTVFGKPIMWYGIIIAVGFLLAAIYAMKRSKAFGLNEDILIDMLLFATPIAIIFARLYYVVFYWDNYKYDPISALYIWEGGIAIYGGIIGAVLTCAVFCKVRKIKLGAVLDIGALGLMIGQMIGRWGNFVNCEAYGTQTDNLFRMTISSASTGQIIAENVHPCFLYESMWLLVGFIFLHFYSKKRKFRGEIFLLYVAWYGLGRGMIEGLRIDSLYFFGTSLRVSQFLGFASCLVAVFILFYNYIFKRHDPEEVTALAYIPKVKGF